MTEGGQWRISGVQGVFQSYVLSYLLTCVWFVFKTHEIVVVIRFCLQELNFKGKVVTEPKRSEGNVLAAVQCFF